MRFREWNRPLQCSHRARAIGVSLTILSLRWGMPEFDTRAYRHCCSMSDKTDYERDWFGGTRAITVRTSDRETKTRLVAYRVSYTRGDFNVGLRLPALGDLFSNRQVSRHA